MSFHILIHFKRPMFVAEDDEDGGDTMAWKTHDEAMAWALSSMYCQTLGYTILEWDDNQGGGGVTGTTSYP